MPGCGEWVDSLCGRSITHAQLLVEKEILLTTIEEEKINIKALQNDVTNLSRDQTKYTGEIASMSNLLQEKEAENERLHEEYQGLEQRHKSTEDILTDQLLISKSVQKEMEEMKQSMEKLYVEKNAIEKRLTNTELKYSTLVGEHKTLQQDYEALEKIHVEKDVIEKRTELKYSTLVGEHKTLQQDYEASKQRMQLVQKVICEKEMSLSSLEAKNEELEMSFGSLWAANEKLELAFGSLKERNKQIEMELNSVKTTNAELAATSAKIEEGELYKSATKTSEGLSKPPLQLGGEIVENPAES